MFHQQLSDVQATNLQLLYAIRAGMDRCMVDTCRKYGMNPDQAERLRAMAHADVWALVHTLGEASLFVPRSDIVRLIDAAPSIVGTLAASHPPRPTQLR